MANYLPIIKWEKQDNLTIGGVLQKKKNSKFFERVKKRSKLPENDIHVYLRLSPKYDAKLSAKKKLWGSKVDEIGIGFISSGYFSMLMHSIILYS